MKTIKQTARQMIRILNSKGWCRGYFENKQGHVCVVGAYDIVNNPWSNMHTVITKAIDSSEMSVVKWNDSQTDKRAVTRMLKKVIRDA